MLGNLGIVVRNEDDCGSGIHKLAQARMTGAAKEEVADGHDFINN